MPTPRETILAALHARLLAPPATVLRGEVLPVRVPGEGRIILRDGEPVEPELRLWPLAHHHQHRAEIEAVVRSSDRDVAFYTLTASIGAARRSPPTARWGALRLGRNASGLPVSTRTCRKSSVERACIRPVGTPVYGS